MRRPVPPFAGTASGPTLRWVNVPRSVPFRNEGAFWVGGRLLTRQPRLAICADLVRGVVTLVFCNRRWAIIAMMGSPTAETAVREAERYYPGLRSHWIDGRVTGREAARYLKRLRDEEGCSFCRRAPVEVPTEGAMFAVRQSRICSDCVKALHTRVVEREAEVARGRSDS
jgi:hypothetical protein